VKITRDVVADLLPLYVAGDVSADTRVLVEEYLAGDADMKALLARQRMESPLPLVDMPPDRELEVLRRVRRSVAVQRWVFGLANILTAMALTTELSFENGHFVGARLLFSSSPPIFVELIVPAAILWIVYFRSKRRVR
jgi:anti-sigma factor RsiW